MFELRHALHFCNVFWFFPPRPAPDFLTLLPPKTRIYLVAENNPNSPERLLDVGGTFLQLLQKFFKNWRNS